MTPTQRSLQKLRAAGYLVAVVEKWNPYAHCRQDLFGFIDLIAINGDETLAVQTTSGDHVAERLEKIRNTPAATTWLESSTRKIVVHGWRKAGARGKRKLWQCREVGVDRKNKGIFFNPMS
jgi:carbonic anhydrase